MKWDAFVGGSFQPQGTSADNSRTVNFYVEPSQGKGATTPAALYPSPGFSVRQALAGIATYSMLGLARAHFFQDSREFAIVESTLWEIAADGSVTDRGDVGDDRLPATISSNGDINSQLFITSARNGFVFDLGTNTLTQIVALNNLAFQGDFLDGYFLCLNDLTSTLMISALGDGSSWTPGTDFAQRSLAGDPWIAMKVCGRFVWLFGELTSEVWYNTSDTFPFAPHPSGLLNYGIRSSWSAGVMGTTIQWLASTRTGRLSVVRAAGFAPEVISPYALDLQLSQYVDPERSYSDVFTYLGHTFYVLSFDSDNVSWVWDATTEMWFEWMSWDTGRSREEAWFGRYYASAFGQHRIFGRTDGQLYEMGPDFPLDVEERLIKRIRRCPAPYNEDKRVFYSDLKINMDVGLGHQVSPTIPPQVMLRISNDGGRTWPVERWQSAGLIGEYKTRVSWPRLGSARRRVFEVTVSDPAAWRISAAYLEAKGESG